MGHFPKIINLCSICIQRVPILQNHGDTKQGIANFVETLSDGEFNQDELEDIADRVDFTSNRLRSVA